MFNSEMQSHYFASQEQSKMSPVQQEKAETALKNDELASMEAKQILLNMQSKEIKQALGLEDMLS